MRGITALLVVKCRFKHVHPMAGSWGTMANLYPRKQDNKEHREGRQVSNFKGDADPIVAFTRPPPVPPFLGPLVALSVFDLWSSRDGDDE